MSIIENLMQSFVALLVFENLDQSTFRRKDGSMSIMYFCQSFDIPIKLQKMFSVLIRIITEFVHEFNIKFVSIHNRPCQLSALPPSVLDRGFERKSGTNQRL